MSARVLVVDDDAVIRHLLATTLREGGYSMAEAHDVAALNKAFNTQQPDLVLLDLQLPDGNGLDVLPEIKRNWPTTEVIVLTGHATFDAAVEAIKRGAFHFQQKPFDNKGLLLLIERALEHKQL